MLDTYRQIVDRFAEDHDVTLNPPNIVIDALDTAISADPDTYRIRMGVIPYTRMERDTIQEQVYEALHDLYDAALGTAVEQHTSALEDLYAPFDPEIAVDDQRFIDLNADDHDSDTTGDQYTNGKYSSLSATIKIDEKYMDDIDPETHTVEHAKLDQIIRHECVHGLHYGTNPHVNALSDHVSNTTDNYTTDVCRAAIEAITRFEQYRIHDRDSNRETQYRQLHDPWQVPDVFTDHTDMDDRGTALFDDPYKLGHFTAHAVDAAFQDVYGEEKGRALTREFLIYAATTPNGLRGSIEASFETRGLLYYPERVRQWEDWLSRRDRPGEHAEEMYDAGLNLMEGADTEQDVLTYFYELHALLHAANDCMDSRKITGLEQVKETL